MFVNQLSFVPQRFYSSRVGYAYDIRRKPTVFVENHGCAYTIETSCKHVIEANDISHDDGRMGIVIWIRFPDLLPTKAMDRNMGLWDSIVPWKGLFCGAVHHSSSVSVANPPRRESRRCQMAAKESDTLRCAYQPVKQERVNAAEQNLHFKYFMGC